MCTRVGHGDIESTVSRVRNVTYDDFPYYL